MLEWISLKGGEPALAPSAKIRLSIALLLGCAKNTGGVPMLALQRREMHACRPPAPGDGRDSQRTAKGVGPQNAA